LSSPIARRILVLLLATIAVVAGVVLYPRLASTKNPLPGQIGDLRLALQIKGEKARGIINEMHGKGVTPLENMIGEYKGAAGSATVYVSRYQTNSDAQETVERMLAGIEKGNTPFNNPRRLTVGSTDVSLCIGLGQAHYFFIMDKSVYWLAADAAVAQVTIVNLIRAVGGKQSGLQT
jgi:hypothetical protein